MPSGIYIIITLLPLLCSGLRTTSLSGDVIGLSSFIFLSDTPMCVPSQAKISRLYEHQGSTSFLKSILNAANHPKNQHMNVLGLIK